MCASVDGWIHISFSQATSRPHESPALGGGILMWQWEQWFVLGEENDKEQSFQVKNDSLMTLPQSLYDANSYCK